MTNSARVTDFVLVGPCNGGPCGGCAHDGQFRGDFQQTSSTTTINNLKAVRIVDKAIMTGCPHPGKQVTIVSAASQIVIDGAAAARVDDPVVCQCGARGRIVRGSPTAFSHG